MVEISSENSELEQRLDSIERRLETINKKLEEGEKVTRSRYQFALGLTFLMASFGLALVRLGSDTIAKALGGTLLFDALLLMLTVSALIIMLTSGNISMEYWNVKTKKRRGIFVIAPSLILISALATSIPDVARNILALVGIFFFLAGIIWMLRSRKDTDNNTT